MLKFEALSVNNVFFYLHIFVNFLFIGKNAFFMNVGGKNLKHFVEFFQVFLKGPPLT
jgi:hypothetical protein